MSIGTARLSGTVLLDGPTGTELERRGYATTLPLWTARAVWDAPSLLSAIHVEYVRAGADILTACTFRTCRYVLAKAGLGLEARALTDAAVQLARACANTATRHVQVAGSIAPLEDCYHPELTPPVPVLERAHRDHADALAAAGVDLLLVETMPTVREAVVASRAALDTGLPVLTSLLPGPDRRLWDGTLLREALCALTELPLALVSINCGAPEWCTAAVDDLAGCPGGFGVYANASAPDPRFGDLSASGSVGEYTQHAKRWLERGARMLGSCCGTGAAHTAALRQLLNHYAQGAKLP